MALTGAGANHHFVLPYSMNCAPGAVRLHKRGKRIGEQNGIRILATMAEIRVRTETCRIGTIEGPVLQLEVQYL